MTNAGERRTSPDARPAPPGDVVVAIDGPAGSGKSTVARGVAERTGLRYLDTGSTYRAVTLALLRLGTPLDDPGAVAAAARGAGLALELDPVPGAASRVLLAGEPVESELRSPAVSEAVSAVSAVPAVRELLVALQRSVMESGGVVAEGRDIGTVVWPAADVKVFLTASAAERARRRANAGGPAESAEQVARRDRLDSTRATSPTRASADAVVLESTDRPADDVVAEIVRLVEAARTRRTR
ncbi:MAG TPA: (d)CMP kinase [Actinomycetota bacterium]|jgi:cytidylate kinase|nr:(d)CMP kinase [Actinomycetota bacterium]